MKQIRNICILLGLLSIILSDFAGLLEIITPQLPFGNIGEVFIVDNNIYIVSSSYKRIQKYDTNSEFIQGWNIKNEEWDLNNMFSGVSVYYSKKKFHVFNWRSRLYRQFDLNGNLLQRKVTSSLDQLNRISSKFHYIKPDNIEVRNSFFTSYIIYTNKEGLARIVKAPIFWFIIRMPFPGVLFLLTGQFLFLICSRKFQEDIWPKIKKRDFYKL